MFAILGLQTPRLSSDILSSNNFRILFQQNIALILEYLIAKEYDPLIVELIKKIEDYKQINEHLFSKLMEWILNMPYFDENLFTSVLGKLRSNDSGVKVDELLKITQKLLVLHSALKYSDNI